MFDAVIPTDSDASSSWAGMDLSGYLDGSYTPPTPTLLTRTDGLSLLYPGLTHSIHGEPESGKSMVVQHECVVRLAAGEAVCYLDFESDPGSIVERLLMLGADPVAVAERFVYLQPTSDPYRRQDDLDALLATLDAHTYTLVVIDGVSESVDVLIGEAKDPNAAAIEWARKLPRLVAERTGAAVVQIDHVVKNAENRGRFAIGGQAKLAALTGAAYAVEVAEPLGRGLRGELVLRVAKDRPGYVRGRCGEYRSDRTQEAARVIVDSTGEDMVVYLTGPRGPKGADERMEQMKERICDHLAGLPADHQGYTTNTIQRDVTGDKTLKVRALAVLVEEGYVTRTPKGQSNYHRLARPYEPGFEVENDD